MCYSGASGFDCGFNVWAACGSPFVDPLAYRYPPSVTHFALLQGKLSLGLASESVRGRVATEVSFGGGSDVVCNFPPPSVSWNYSVQSCSDVLDYSVPWLNSSRHCDWGHVVTSNNVIYSNTLYVDHVEEFDFAGSTVQRTVTTSFPLSVSFPRTVTGSSSAGVSTSGASQLGLEAFLSKIEYDHFSESVTIELVTSVEWPYRLNVQDLYLRPSGFIVNYVQPVGGLPCPATDSSKCLQKFAALLTPTTACNFSGNYGMDFVVDCRSSSSCDYNVNGSRANVTFSAVGSDYCGTTGVDVGLSGTLQLAGNSSTATYGDTLGFTLFTFSDASIISTSLSEVTMTSNGNTTILFANGSVPYWVPGDANFQVDNACGTVAEVCFSLTAVPSLMPNAGATYVFAATAEIEYEGVTPLSSNALRELGSGLVKSTKSVRIGDDGDDSVRYTSPAAALAPVF